MGRGGHGQSKGRVVRSGAGERKGASGRVITRSVDGHVAREIDIARGRAGLRLQSQRIEVERNAAAEAEVTSDRGESGDRRDVFQRAGIAKMNQTSEIHRIASGDYNHAA